MSGDDHASYWSATGAADEIIVEVICYLVMVDLGIVNAPHAEHAVSIASQFHAARRYGCSAS